MNTQVAGLKGRNNYVCLFRLKQELAQGSFIEQETITKLRQIHVLVQAGSLTERGDLAEIAEDDAVWQHATARADQCLGSACPDYKACYSVAAKRRAQTADIVVVNHHLLCADIALRENGVSELLPEAQVIVIDEAHQLPNAASGFFGANWGVGGHIEWLRTVNKLLGAKLGGLGLGQLKTLAAGMQSELRLCSNLLPSGRYEYKPAQANQSSFHAAVLRLAQYQQGAMSLLENMADIPPEAQPLILRGQQYQNVLDSFAARDTQGQQSQVTAVQGNDVFWVDKSDNSVKLIRTELNAGHHIGQNMQSDPKPWVLLSATLAPAGNFSFIQKQLGIKPDEAITLEVKSPFNYAKQGVLFVPRHFTAPNSEEHSETIATYAYEMALTLGGRTAMLCTSRRAVEKMTLALRKLVEENTRAESITILSQLEHGRTAMIEHFREHPRAILVGAASLWEGLDLPGNLLNAVMIDKIPFASPDDPILSARMALCTAQKRSSFAEIQLPEAALTLKQGAGRLIRTESDWGVLAVFDPRLHHSSYGKTLLADLPAFPLSTSFDEMLVFCENKLSEESKQI